MYTYFVTLLQATLESQDAADVSVAVGNAPIWCCVWESRRSIPTIVFLNPIENAFDVFKLKVSDVPREGDDGI